MPKYTPSTPQPRLCAVYAIQNIANGMTYIGSTVHIYRRWRDHRSKLKNGMHENPNLQKEYDTFGVDNFTYEILELASQDTLHSLEQKYLDDTFGRNACYNIFPTANSPLLRKYTAEQKAQISQRNKGRTISEEHRRKLSIALKGRPKPPQVIESVRRAQTGRVHSHEERLARSKQSKGANNANAKISEDDVREIKKLLAKKVSAPKISRLFPIAISQIYRIKKGESWGHVT